MGAKKRVDGGKTGNQDKEPDRGKSNPANGVMRNHRGDRVEAHAAWNSGKLAGIAHRDAKQKDNREGIAPLARERGRGRTVPRPAEQIWRIFKWWWLFGKNTSPAEGQWNRRAETECGEEEKCKTMV